MSTLRRQRRWTGIVLTVLLAMGLLLAACDGSGARPGSDDGQGETGRPNGEPAPSAGGTINIGYIAWDEDIAVSFLWKALLEERGYEVEVTPVDVAPAFAGVADGSLDLFMDVWLPSTHSDYMADFGGDVEVIGTWFDQADLGWAVPDYVEARSMEDLAGMADVFGKRIIGIEPGAGLMRISRENAMPGYGLEDWELVESSTQAMLAELDRAITAQEPIVVTLWRPHWAFGAYPIRYLEDPQGLMNPEGAEHIEIIARKGFSQDFPEVASWLGNFSLSQEALADLEVVVLNAPDELQGAQEWLEENRDIVDAWFND